MNKLVIRETDESEVERLFEIRSQTRENAISRERLAALGITPETWRAALRSETEKGWVCVDGSKVVAFCEAESVTGEILVLAVLPEYEGRGVGKRLLTHAIQWLHSNRCPRIWLAASPDPRCRAHGFYRAQGWISTGERQAHGDEILVLEDSRGQEGALDIKEA